MRTLTNIASCIGDGVGRVDEDKTTMGIPKDDGRLPRRAKLIFSGEMQEAVILELSAKKARVELLERTPNWIGRFLALSIAELPVLPAYVRSIEGMELEIAFRTELHQTVLDEALAERSR